MPRVNKPRLLQAEDVLAERVAQLRTVRGWTYEGLAKRMTDVGCAIQPSALYKIEKGEPRRRITVDELFGLSLAFGMSVDELIGSPGLAAQQRLRAALAEAQQRREEYERVRDSYGVAVSSLAIAINRSDQRDGYRHLGEEMQRVTPRNDARIHEGAFWADVLRAMDDYEGLDDSDDQTTSR